MLINQTNKNRINLPTIPCAFHLNQIITHFCSDKQCLLPMCKQCVNIHRREHSCIPQSINLRSIDDTVMQMSQILKVQDNRVEKLYADIIKKYNQCCSQHQHIKINLLLQRDQIIKNIYQQYEIMLRQLENNSQRRNKWFHEFTANFNELRNQLKTIHNSLDGEKYLRTIIMWNRIEPIESITNISHKIAQNWQTPYIKPFNFPKLISLMKQERNFKLLEIEGDFGIFKLKKKLKIVKQGQSQQKIHIKCSGILLTHEKKLKTKINSCSTINE